MAKRAAATKPPQNPYQSSSDSADLSPANQVAFEILAVRRDVMPSIERIMNAGLDEEVAVDALTRFRAALDEPGNPDRDPRVAVANAAESAG